MRTCPVLPRGSITSFVKFSWSCLGSFDFVLAGKFRVFTVSNTMMISKFLEPIYQSLSKLCVAVGAYTKCNFWRLSDRRERIRRKLIFLWHVANRRDCFESVEVYHA